MARVAIVAGICTHHDAISNVVRLQEQVLAAAGHDVRVYVQHTDFPGPTHVKVSDAWRLMSDGWFLSVDVVIYHFGIAYGLFDALLLTHPHARSVVHFHNVTPPELLHGQARIQAMKGIDQIAIASRADAVWSDSVHNTECLLEWSDVESSRVVTMPLCVPWVHEESIAARAGHLRHAREVRVLSVGRLVPAKGQHDLVAAIAALPHAQLAETTLEFIASSEHSDLAFVEQLRSAAEELGVAERVTFAFDLPDAEVHGRYLTADLFVSSSYHEGFCVPVIEALVAGCAVVVTDAGALPETVAGCGTVVPVGDVAAMSAAISSEIGALSRNTATVDRESVANHVIGYSLDSFAERTLDALDRVLTLPMEADREMKAEGSTPAA